jgi:hypothetical protein
LAPTGGATGSGGITGSGGLTNTGGLTSSGGVTISGGITGSGGVAISGGTTSSGGIASSGGVTATGGGPLGHFQMEKVDRGVVAVKVDAGVYVGWRMFGYEYDPMASNVSYNLYRDGTKVTNVTDSTSTSTSQEVGTTAAAWPTTSARTTPRRQPVRAAWALSIVALVSP